MPAIPSCPRQQINIIMKQNTPTRPLLRPLVSFTDTFESSQQEKEERFLIDRSLARGIVENNSSIIVDEHHEAFDMGGLAYDEEEQNNRVLFEYRNKYDKVKTDTLDLEARINHEKEEKQRLEEEHAALMEAKKDAERACKNIKNDLNNQSYNLDQTVMSLDCRKAMEERLKSDIIYYKKKIYDTNIELMKKKQEIKLHSNSFQRQKKLSVRCRNLLFSVEKTLHKNQLERSFRIDDAKEMLSSKQEHVLRQREREYGLQRSMLAAMSQKLPQEKEHIKLLYSNKLVKKILHCKMESLMKQYKEVSDSFNQIKSNTTVRTAEEFVSRYLTKNVIYGQLSESISKLQPRISLLEEEKSALQAQQAALKTRNEQLAGRFKDKKEVELDRAFEQVQALHLKIERINKYRNSWTNWALSTVAMFRGVPRSQIRSKYDYLGLLLGDTLRMLLKHLASQEEKQASISEQAMGKQLAKANLKLNDLIVRNIRIKTLGNELTHREDDEVEYDLVSEKDYLHHARRAVKKQRIARNLTISKA